MKFWRKNQSPVRLPISTLLITQNAIGTDGKPGTLEVPGVVSTGIVGNHMCGYNAKGLAIVLVPLTEIALAIVSEK